ncbi:MAG: hypothetical protein MUE98_00920 [Rhodobacteraceae bacterium]|nr:hypothetical protein [Paracoccaceae bacterium]
MLGVLEQGYGVIGVKRARPGDMDTVLRLVSDFRARCGAEVAYEPEVFVSFVRENLDDDDFLILLLDGDQGLLIGCITDTVYSSARIAKELLWYTRPSCPST